MIELLLTVTFPHSDGSTDEVMTTDGSGNVSWTDVNTIVSGDNLGNHSATSTLDLNDHMIIDIGSLVLNEDRWIGIGASDDRIAFDGSNNRVKVYSDLNINNSYTFPHSDGTVNQIITTDGSGNLSWANATGDNLGNHIATTTLNMNNHYINNAQGVEINEDRWIGIGLTDDRITFDGSGNLIKVYSNLNINNSYTFPHSDGSTDEVMTTDGSGNVSWTDVNTIVSGDNLGNHTATTTLNMNNHYIDGVRGVTIVDGQWVGIGSSSERIRFDGSGGDIELMGADVGIGTTSPTTKLHVVDNVDGNYVARFINTGADANSYGISVQAGNSSGTADRLIRFLNSSGTAFGGISSVNGVVSYGAKSAKSNSKGLIKTNINAISTIKTIQVVDYYPSKNAKNMQTGFLGEEIQKIFPDQVIYEEDSEEFIVDRSILVPVLTKAIQEQQAQLEGQNNKIETLEKQIQELKDLIQNK